MFGSGKENLGSGQKKIKKEKTEKFIGVEM